jgi:hypothetical protein
MLDEDIGDDALSGIRDKLLGRGVEDCEEGGEPRGVVSLVLGGVGEEGLGVMKCDRDIPLAKGVGGRRM